MPSESQIPIDAQDASKRFAVRLALFYGGHVRIARRLSAVLSGLAEGGRDRSIVDRDHHGGACRHALYGASVRHGSGRTAAVAARRHHRHGVCHRAGFDGRRHPASGAAGISGLRRHLLPVDADDAADGCLCVAGRGALPPQLRTAAAMGLGRLRGRRVGVRAAGRCDGARTPDLGDRGGGGAQRAGQSGLQADRQSEAGRRRRSAARARCCATPAFSPSSWRRR